MLKICNKRAKPFLKWAGGKTQLIPQLDAYLPIELKEGQIKKYAEPFIGGGAFFFYLAQKFEFESILINDLNPDLVITYTTIQKQVESLIERLFEIQRNYLQFDEEKRKEYFYSIRENFNSSLSGEPIERAAQIIFLNRTCFNGLYRVNSKGGFNVPFGKYENPCICDADNLRAVSALLQRAEIRQGDFSVCRGFADINTFIYFDPPYRPVSRTANFNAYAGEFGDSEQLRLSHFFQELHEVGSKIMLSNSAPEDKFFHGIYEGFQIEEVFASRMINSKADKRGQIKEVLIMNYAIN